MTFVTKWECYQYMVMPFGLKNAPAIFSRIVVSTFKDFIHKFPKVYFYDWTVFGLVRDHIESVAHRLYTSSRNILKVVSSLRKVGEV